MPHYLRVSRLACAVPCVTVKVLGRCCDGEGRTVTGDGIYRHGGEEVERDAQSTDATVAADVFFSFQPPPPLSLSSCRMQAQGGVSAKGVGIYGTVIDTWVRPRMSATL
jgi:hypothetical protein